MRLRNGGEVRYDNIRYDRIIYDTTWYDMIIYDTTWYDMIIYDTIRYNIEAMRIRYGGGVDQYLFCLLSLQSNFIMSEWLFDRRWKSDLHTTHDTILYDIWYANIRYIIRYDNTRYDIIRCTGDTNTIQQWRGGSILLRLRLQVYSGSNISVSFTCFVRQEVEKRPAHNPPYDTVR